MMNAGQKMDILFTSDTMVPFLTNVRQGNFLPLEDLLPVYAPKTYADIPDAAWDAATIDGHIYGVIPLKDLADNVSLQYDEVLCEELSITPPEAYGWQTPYELMDLFYEAQEKRNEAYPDQKDYPVVRIHRNLLTLFNPHEPINFVVGCNIEDTPGGFEGKGNGETVFNFIDTPEYLKYVQTLKKMTDDGLLAYDPENFDKDKVLDVKYVFVTAQGIVTDYTTDNPNNKIVMPREAFMYNNYVRAQMNAIAATCEYPERAMQVIEMFNQDKMVATMLRFGLKDTHWKEIGENAVTFEGTQNEDLKDRGYFYWYGTTWGSLRNIMIPDTENPELIDRIIDMTQNSNQRGNLGFTFDETPVVNEIAACRSVYDEYHKVLYNSLIEDVDTAVADYVAKLAANGVDKIVEEAQNQLTAWRTEVGRPTK